jgi:LysR family transcriptional regulator, low CO2-responsive transcriptional regulator
MLLPHLDTFAQAAEMCSFTSAALALRLTQAAVSQRIQSLERTLNESLFHRRGGRVVLTDAGRTLYSYTQQILELHAEARTQITGRKFPVAGELVISASSIPGKHLLPAVISGFSKKYPNIHIRAAVGDSAAVIDQVERGEASVGLVGRKDDNPNLEFRFLVSDHMAIVVSRRHDLAGRKTVTLDQLATHPLILRESGSGLRHCFEKSLDRAGWSLSDLNVTLELGSNEAIKKAVQRGVGVAVLSAIAVRKEVEAGRLHGLRLQGIRCERDMFIVRDRRRVAAPPARMFLTFLESHRVVNATS